MKRVLVQPCSPSYEIRRGNGNRNYDDLKSYLLRTAKQIADSEDKRDGFRVTVLEPHDVHLWVKGRSSGLRYSFDDARRD